MLPIVDAAGQTSTSDWGQGLKSVVCVCVFLFGCLVAAIWWLRRS